MKTGAAFPSAARRAQLNLAQSSQSADGLGLGGPDLRAGRSKEADS